MIQITKKIKLAATMAAFAVLVPVSVAMAAVPPQPTPAGGAIDQRVAQRKTERGTVLSDPDYRRLVSSCTQVQDKLRAIQNTDVEKLQKYVDTYHKVDARLWLATAKLKLASKDTFELEKQRLAYVQKVTVFEATDVSYRQALDDSIVMNCQADPAGFQAMIDTASIYQTQLRDQAADTRSHIVNALKPLLSGFVADLQPKTPAAGDN